MMNLSQWSLMVPKAYSIDFPKKKTNSFSMKLFAKPVAAASLGIPLGQNRWIETGACF